MSGTDPVTIGTGTCTDVRQLAILVSIVDPGKFAQLEIWIPKSVLHAASDVYRLNDVGKIVVVEWWAEEHESELGLRRKRPLPMKPPSKKWLKDQQARMARAKRG